MTVCMVWSQSMFVLTNDEHVRLSWFQPEFFLRLEANVEEMCIGVNSS